MQMLLRSSELTWLFYLFSHFSEISTRHPLFPCAPSHLSCVFASQHMLVSARFQCRVFFHVLLSTCLSLFDFRVVLCSVFVPFGLRVCAFQQVSVSVVFVPLHPCRYVATIAVSDMSYSHMLHSSLSAFVLFIQVDAEILVAGGSSD